MTIKPFRAVTMRPKGTNTLAIVVLMVSLVISLCLVLFYNPNHTVHCPVVEETPR